MLIPPRDLSCNIFSLECISGFDPGPASHDSWESLDSYVRYYWRGVAAWISSQTENTPNNKDKRNRVPRCLGINRAFSALLPALKFVVNSSKLSLCHTHNYHSVDVLECCCLTPGAAGGELKLKSWRLVCWDGDGMQHHKHRRTLVSSIHFAGCKSNLFMSVPVVFQCKCPCLS